MNQSVPVTKTEEQSEESDSSEQQDEENSDTEDLFDEEQFDSKLAHEILENINKLEELSRVKTVIERIVLKLDGLAKHNKNKLLIRLRRGYAISKSEAKTFKMRMDKLDLWSRRLNVLKKEKAKLTVKLDQHRDKVSTYLSKIGHDPCTFRWQVRYGWLPQGVNLLCSNGHRNPMVCIMSNPQAARDAQTNDHGQMNEDT